jgi:hypothetical protein
VGPLFRHSIRIFPVYPKEPDTLRVVEGLDVNKDPLMYLKKLKTTILVMFLLLGIPVLWRGFRTNEYYALSP